MPILVLFFYLLALVLFLVAYKFQLSLVALGLASFTFAVLLSSTTIGGAVVKL